MMDMIEITKVKSNLVSVELRIECKEGTEGSVPGFIMLHNIFTFQSPSGTSLIYAAAD
jgi:hypothetical protein